MSSTGARRRRSIDDRVIDGLVTNHDEFIQSLKVFGNTLIVGPGSAGGTAPPAPPTGGGTGTPKIIELGTLTDPFEVDFTIHSARELVGNIDKNTTITFTNIPSPTLLLHMRLYIQSVDPTIIIGGTNLKTAFPALHPLAVDDFLDIQLKSTDQTNVTVISVKKTMRIRGEEDHRLHPLLETLILTIILKTHLTFHGILRLPEIPR